MSVDIDGDVGKELTLAFDLSAIERCEEPQAVFADARQWSRFVGVVANQSDAIASFVRNHGLRQDFELGGRDKWLALGELRSVTDTDRHVYVGTTLGDRRAARQTGWEFIHIHEAADKAGWSISGERKPGGGILSRLVTRLFG